MQKTSELYQDLLASYHWKETRLLIGDYGRLITKQGEAITFGGVSILVGGSGAEGGYDESRMISVTTKKTIFKEDLPQVGGCVSGEIEAEMYKPYGDLPKLARIVPYIRLTDGNRHSEWIQKGVYYLDTQEKVQDGTTLQKIRIHGFDALVKAEMDYPQSDMDWPASDISVVREICTALGIRPDERTVAVMTEGYEIPYPAGYSCREVLEYIAAMYAGGFVMSDTGELLLVTLSGIPAETRYLLTENGQSITFGGVRILV